MKIRDILTRPEGRRLEFKQDDKTITEQIGRQPGEALKFIQRNVSRSSRIEGVYTKSRWEYPMAAIREALRNAVVHRDYSLTGKDIKVAIYDDMVEITSPGTLPPSIDFQEMEARQSDIRNRIIAPVFKRLGLIDQWGNGLKIIAEELRSYPDIELKWFERGLQFQVQFVRKNFHPAVQVTESDGSFGTWPAPGRGQISTRFEPDRKTALQHRHFGEYQGVHGAAGLERPEQIQGKIYHASAGTGRAGHDHSGQAKQFQTGILSDGKRTDVSGNPAK